MKPSFMRGFVQVGLLLAALVCTGAWNDWKVQDYSISNRSFGRFRSVSSVATATPSPTPSGIELVSSDQDDILTGDGCATVDISGTNRLLVVFQSENASGGHVDPSFDGGSLTCLTEHADGYTNNQICYLANPPTGSHSACILLQDNAAIAAFAFKNVDQTTPIVGAAMTCENGSSTSPSVTKTGTTSGNLVLDSVSAFDGSYSDVTRTQGSGQTKICDHLANDGGNGYSVSIAGSYKDASGSVTSSWTLSRSLPWVSCAIEVKKN